MAQTSTMQAGRPSANEMLHQLAAESEAERARLVGPLVALPPPTLFGRLLVASGFLLLAAMTWGLAVVCADSLRVVDGVRSRREADALLARQLPAGEDLVDAGTLATALAQHPLAAGQIHARRALALRRLGQLEPALAAFREARLTTVVALPPAVEIGWADCLADLGRWAEVRDRMLACRFATWPEAEHQRAVALLAEAWARVPGAPAPEEFTAPTPVPSKDAPPVRR